MCSAQVPEFHRTTGLNQIPPWRVVSVDTLPGYRLDVTFHDGTRGKVDLAAMINGRDAGVFHLLRDPELFGKVAIEHGAPSWPGDIDLAPDALYRAVKNHSQFPID